MLLKPVNGWTTVSIKDFQAEASYLVDIPFQWLNAFLSGFRYKIPVSLFIDEEGSECFITTYYDGTYIITDRDDEVACKFTEIFSNSRMAFYMTNVIESLNSCYRRLNRQRSVFSSPQALLKVLSRSNFEATKKWTMPTRNWGKVRGELSIMFLDRLTD